MKDIKNYPLKFRLLVVKDAMKTTDQDAAKKYGVCVESVKYWKRGYTYLKVKEKKNRQKTSSKTKKVHNCTSTEKTAKISGLKKRPVNRIEEIKREDFVEFNIPDHLAPRSLDYPLNFLPLSVTSRLVEIETVHEEIPIKVELFEDCQNRDESHVSLAEEALERTISFLNISTSNPEVREAEATLSNDADENGEEKDELPNSDTNSMVGPYTNKEDAGKMMFQLSMSEDVTKNGTICFEEARLEYYQARTDVIKSFYEWRSNFTMGSNRSFGFLPTANPGTYFWEPKKLRPSSSLNVVPFSPTADNALMTSKRKSTYGMPEDLQPLKETIQEDVSFGSTFMADHFDAWLTIETPSLAETLLDDWTKVDSSQASIEFTNDDSRLSLPEISETPKTTSKKKRCIRNRCVVPFRTYKFTEYGEQFNSGWARTEHLAKEHDPEKLEKMKESKKSHTQKLHAQFRKARSSLNMGLEKSLMTKKFKQYYCEICNKIVLRTERHKKTVHGSSRSNDKFPDRAKNSTKSQIKISKFKLE